MTEGLRAAVLGLVQGLTEYLPISSTAHLILLPKFFDWQDQGLTFDAAANTGTLLAVLLYFRRDLLDLLRGAVADTPAAAGSSLEVMRPRQFLGWLVIASVPLGVVGYLAQGWIAGDARRGIVIAVASLVFGVLLGIADRSASSAGRSVDDLGWRDAVVLGVAQAMALVPGTSRSGVVMTAGLFSGLGREAAARVAFLMAIPAGLMVAFKDLLDLVAGRSLADSWLSLMIVTVVAAACGYAVIAFLLAWLRRRSLLVFVLYRIALSLLLLWFVVRSG